MTNSEKDVIAAIATPHGRGAISCIRLSGAGSVETAKKVTEGFDGKSHALMVNCKFSSKVRDKIMAVAFLGNKSYTGEESVELYFHGGKYLTEQALLCILDAGARMAEAGEFTRRAFMNGKIDLTQAEGIGDLIDADSMLALDSAYEQSEGKTRKTIDEIYNQTVTAAAKAEVSIDYPEEDVQEQTNEETIKDIDDALENIRKELKGYNGGRIKREGLRVVLTGKTNAGKSTLFNTLLGEDRAIVSDEEGTTRDAVEEKMIYRGCAFVLVDTAGLRETDSKAEKMGIERSIREAKEAEVVIRVVRKKEQISGETVDENTVIVLNSCKSFISEEQNGSNGIIVLNAKTGEGAERLKEKLYEISKFKTQSGGSVNNARQYAALKVAEESLERAKIAVNTLTADCVCADLREALDSLGSVTGKNPSDSVIDEIFSKFCVGK